MKQLSGKAPTVANKDFWSLSRDTLTEAPSCSAATWALPVSILPEPSPTVNFRGPNYLPCHVILPPYRTNLPQRVPELAKQCLYLPQHFMLLMLLELSSQTVAKLIYTFPFLFA